MGESTTGNTQGQAPVDVSFYTTIVRELAGLGAARVHTFSHDLRTLAIQARHVQRARAQRGALARSLSSRVCAHARAFGFDWGGGVRVSNTHVVAAMRVDVCTFAACAFHGTTRPPRHSAGSTCQAGACSFGGHLEWG